MNKVYKRIGWENSPSTASPLNEANLNKMDYALDAVDTRVTEIYNQKDAMATATTAANEAADNANAAAVSANAAAANANEAAQAVLDEKYILTATTEMVKSGSASPTARGNALLEKLVGSSWQRKLTGKNKLINEVTSKTVNGVAFTVNKDKSITVKGTATDAVYFQPYEASPMKFTPIVGETYNLYGYNNGNGNIQGYFMGINGSPNWSSYVRTVNITTESDISYNIYIANGTTVDYTFYPMVLLASEADNTYEPYCGGTPSPNPEYPQEIRSTGDMGWFDGEWVTGCYINNSGGTSIGTQCAICKNDIPCKENDVVLVEYDGELNHTAQSVTIAFYDSTGAMLKRFASGNTDSSLSATAPTNSAYFRFDLRNGVNGVVDTTVKTKVTINDIEYVTILESVRTNVLPSKRFTVNRAGDVTYTFYEDGRIGVNGTSTGGTSYVTLAVTLDKGKYILTGIPTGTSLEQYIVLDGDNPVDTGEGAIFEGTKRKTYLVRTARLTSGESADNVIVSPMIRKLDSEGNPIGDDTYVPHESKRIYIPLTKPLCSVPNSDVADELVPVDGVYKAYRKFQMVVFDGSDDEGWVHGTNPQTDSEHFYTYSLNNTKYNGLVRASHFINEKAANGAIMGNALNCYPSTSTGLTDLNTWLAWLAENNMILIYEVAEPYYEDLEQTPFYELQSFDEATHVAIAGLHENLEPTFAIRFPRHEDGALATTGYCDGKKAKIENEALKAEIEEVKAAMLALSQE